MKHADTDQHSERQKVRLALALVATGIALSMAGLIPPYFLGGVGAGWLLKIALDSIYDS